MSNEEQFNPDPGPCIDCHTTKGVSWQWPGYGFKSFPRCDSCAEKRLKREDENKEKYMGISPPSDFDEMDAGESWSEDY